VVIGASLDAEPKARKAKLSVGVTYPLMAESTPLYKAYEANLLPTMFIIGKDGKVLWKGYEKTDAMLKTLEDAFAEKK
jgi:hypothetical protein